MLKGTDGNSKSNYYIENWALRIKCEFHVTTCSNYADSMHGVINRSLGHCISKILLAAKPNIEELFKNIEIDNKKNDRILFINTNVRVILQQIGFLKRANFGIIPYINESFFIFKINVV